MITSWRIVAAEHADTAFSGDGARLYGGRWNTAGIPLVYTAQGASLAALELLVRLRREERMPNHILFACSFGEKLVERLELKDVPQDWRNDPAPASLKAIGDEWARSGRTGVLRVPSAVIETEYNYLLNPEHPDFSRIQIAEPIPFSLDMRLIRRD
ncbi:MAG: RES family NAD+ phosphorylase [Thermoanaerobaculia bacterium]